MLKVNLNGISIHFHDPENYGFHTSIGPNINLTYPIIILADCKSSNLVYQFQCKKWNAFYIEKKDQIFSKSVNGHCSICTVVNSDLLVPIHTQSHQLPFQECWSVHIIHKLPDATPTMSATNLKQHINSYFNTNNFQILTSGNLFGYPPYPLPFSLLVLWSAYFYSWWKPQCWLKTPVLYVLTFIFLCSRAVCRYESGRYFTFLLFLIYSCHFTFPGFPFTLIMEWVDYCNLGQCR